ncbi:MAG: DJ-1/PfpI family protein [Clostridia bacterium]|nr:DJ-1/PfpI family protein [Clostridia bacterium]
MVYLFLANGFGENEALCPLDLLRRAGVEVTTVGINGAETVMGAHGICVHADLPDTMYRDSKPEMIILPGGMPGAKNLDESRVVDTALRAAASSGAYLAAICAAPMILGHRGYLEGKKAICFPGFESELAGASLSDERVVRDGNIITAAGMGVALEFGLALVAALKGDEIADQLRRTVLAD